MCKIKFSYIAFLALIGVIFSFCFSQYSLTASSNFQPVQDEITEEIEKNAEDKAYLSVFYGNALIQSNNPITIKSKKKVEKIVINPQMPGKIISVFATAYSSTVDQCDSSPFITASGTRVHDGTLAANFLRFGTRVKFPELYGEKIFIVEDRMKPSSLQKVDLWFPIRNEAIVFGAKRTKMVVLDF
jgi:3D (Asp-Asp-Asp) domain-containing protein